jgi:hypothetical protein
MLLSAERKQPVIQDGDTEESRRSKAQQLEAYRGKQQAAAD